MNRRLILAVIPILYAIVLALFAPPVPAVAQTPELTVNDVAEDLYCPLCSGLTVNVCELEVCDDMREVIAQKIAEGASEAEIQAYFIEQYGQKVVAKPATSGFDLTAWILPFTALGLGALGLFFWLRNRPQPHLAPIAPTTDADPYAAQLERELRRLDE